ncbi:MAG: alpha/beta fold hydrolase [Chloroflexota bacterium]
MQSYKKFGFIVLFMLLLSLSACIDLSRTPLENDISDTHSASRFVFEDNFFENDCPFELAVLDITEAELTCGFLLVPENRNVPDSLELELAVAIVHSKNNPKPDPILYLEGGPGGSALTGIDSWIDTSLRDDRDIILIDQRGTGYSFPGLHCEETDIEDTVQAAEDCRDSLLLEGIDLTQYHSANSAADIRDLRTALNIDQWNLLGISYGTRLALTVMRDYPEGIRSVVIDSVYPPNVDAYTEQAKTNADAVMALLAGCAADDYCNGAYPDLATRFYKMLDNLYLYPVYVDEVLGSDVVDEEEMLDDAAIISWLVNSLYDTSTIPTLPSLLSTAADGDYAPLMEVIYGMGEEEDEGYQGRFRYQAMGYQTMGHQAMGYQTDDEEWLSDASGMFNSVECHEEIPFSNYEAGQALVADYPIELVDPLLRDMGDLFNICEIWGAGEAQPIEDEAVVSDLPTLILVGEYDPVTPPSWGKVAAKTLRQHTYVEVPRGGHSLIDAGDCPLDIIQTFITNPTESPDISCVESMILEFE